MLDARHAHAGTTHWQTMRERVELSHDLGIDMETVSVSPKYQVAIPS